MEIIETNEIRIYTGSGFEDFEVGKRVSGPHILGGQNSRNEIVKSIVIIQEEKSIVIEFHSGKTMKYVGLNYRFS